jgi:DNA repair exonuclease SbcCD ATPase subunit
LDSFKIREKAHKDYSSKMKEMNRRLSEAANVSDEISTAFSRLQTWQMEYQNIIINRRQLADKFVTYIKFTEAQVNNLLSKYRQINVLNRKMPPPQYFGVKWVFPEVIAEPPESAELIKDFQAKMQKVYENIDGIQNDIENEVRELAGIIMPVSKALER